MTDGEFDRCVNDLRPKLVRNAYQFVENWDDAEDVTQDILIYAWTKRDTIKDLAGFLFASVRSRSFNLIRSRKNKPLSYDDHFEGEDSGSLTSYYVNLCPVSQKFRELSDVMLSMRITQKQLHRFWLHFYDGYTLAEVAAMEKVSITSASDCIYGAAKSIRKAVAKRHKWAT